MKYIKKFESERDDYIRDVRNIQKKADNDLKKAYKVMKKYILFHDVKKFIESGIYFILEKDRIEACYDHTNLFIVTKKLYTYNLNTDKLKNNKKQEMHYNLSETSLSYIMKDSDDLQELLDCLPPLKNVNKFNL